MASDLRFKTKLFYLPGGGVRNRDTVAAAAAMETVASVTAAFGEIGLDLVPEWVRQHLRRKFGPDTRLAAAPMPQLEAHVFTQLLLADLSCALATPGLPPNLRQQEAGSITGPVLVQVTGAADTCQSRAGQLTHAAPERRTLKLELSDGHQVVVGYELEPIPQLTVADVGIKVLIKGAKISHGVLLLGPNNVQVLGGGSATAALRYEVATKALAAENTRDGKRRKVDASRRGHAHRAHRPSSAPQQPTAPPPARAAPAPAAFSAASSTTSKVTAASQLSTGPRPPQPTHGPEPAFNSATTVGRRLARAAIHGTEVEEDTRIPPQRQARAQNFHSRVGNDHSSPPDEPDFDAIADLEQETMALAAGVGVMDARGDVAQGAVGQQVHPPSPPSFTDAVSISSTSVDCSSTNRSRRSLGGAAQTTEPSSSAQTCGQTAPRTAVAAAFASAAAVGTYLAPLPVATDTSPLQTVTNTDRARRVDLAQANRAGSSGGEGANGIGGGRFRDGASHDRPRSIRWLRQYGTASASTKPVKMLARFVKPVTLHWKDLSEYSLLIGAVVLDSNDDSDGATVLSEPNNETVSVTVSNSVVQQRLMGGLSCIEFNQRYKLAKQRKDKADKKHLSDKLRDMNEHLHFGKKGQYLTMTLEWTGGRDDMPVGRVVAVE